jgi:NTP pyrophosphatase (non-canonical NTP hydrolase)
VREKTTSGQILLFPNHFVQGGKVRESVNDKERDKAEASIERRVVLSGTYRKDPKSLLRTFEMLKESGLTVLSPTSPFIDHEKDGFVYMEHESTLSPNEIENKHLDAIQNADFVWFFAPDGYVGPTGALEVGFARACGIPVFSDCILQDTTLRRFVTRVDSPSTVLNYFATNRILPPAPALTSFQNYYRRVALQRGYSKENAKDCLMLMVEEVGELARALRKRTKAIRHGPDITNQEDIELADVFIYVVHMANILNIDLSKIVREKEMINSQKLAHGA